MNPSAVQIAGALLFAVAIAHTFSTAPLRRLAQRSARHGGLFHLLGEVEVVFGLWAFVLMLFMGLAAGRRQAIDYIDSRHFTEPLFVFAIMVVAGSKPILQLSALLTAFFARRLPLPHPLAIHFLALSLIPLLGSLVTEPAAMTLAALTLRDRIFVAGVSGRLKYATLGVLFVNVSIGGTLTAFAAPPVLMVAAAWQWDSAFMLSAFGWKAALAVVVNAAGASLWFRREIVATTSSNDGEPAPAVPASAMAASAVFLIGVVVFAHHPAIFMGLLLFFIGYSVAYPRHHDPLILREALLVAFFLAGLVVLGGQQSWWLQPLLTSMSPTAVYYGATALTAVTDNAALTYLGSLVPGLSDEFKYSLVAGAVSGGGLSVIANAPNPAGYSLLRSGFDGESIGALGLFAAALAPTAVALAAFRLL